MLDLFSDFQLRGVWLRNRIAVSPMCQYSAVDGVVNDWHLVHLGSLAAGGPGLVVAEATAVAPEGRITPGCTGLWTDAQAEAWKPIVHFIEKHGAVPGIQLAHSGRKGSASRPWEGGAHLPSNHPEAWEPIGPSALALGGNLSRVPREMSVGDIQRVQADFVSAAIRAREAGFKWLVLHFAHGYLAQSFFSPLANHRTDRYGGSFENRSRFILETLNAVRAVWPEKYPLTARLGVIDYVDGEQPMEESIELVRQMKTGGLDLIDVSMGFNTPDQSRIPWSEHAFLAPIAQRIGQEANIRVATSWNIKDPHKADELIRSEKIDLAMIGTALLSDPHWPYHCAQALGRKEPHRVLPDQYAYWLKPD